MKLSTISIRYSKARYDILLESILLENQLEYLTRKYPEVTPQQIQQAIDLDRKNAEKLVLGLKNGTITEIEPGSVEAVAHLDPFAKVSNKSEAELAYDQAVRDAKKIHPKYWQWILRIKKDNPEAQFDEGIFHYLEAEGLNTDDIKELSLDQVNQASRTWHDEQFSNQQAGGSYTLTPQKDAVLTIGAYAWVPVNSADARTEGSKMQNCIGTYCNPSDYTKIFSLRNSFNNPHISLSVGKSEGFWYIKEIKGKQNKQPIPKYVPYALAMCEYLFTKGVKLLDGDFWNLPSPDLHKYVRYYGDAVDRLRSDIIDKITDEELNALVLEKGVTRGFPDSSNDNKLFARLNSKTFYAILELSRSQRGEQSSSIKMIKLAISNGLLDENETVRILEKFGASRSIEMLVKARFRPEQFIEELKKVHPDDFSRVYSNYNDAIEAYEGINDYFGELLINQIDKSNEYEFAMPIIEKSPSDVLVKIIDGTIKTYGGSNYTVSSHLANRCFDALINRAMKTSDPQAIINVLSMMPSTFHPYNYRKFSNDDDYYYGYKSKLSTNDIIFSVDYDDIPKLYEACKHNKYMQKAISIFINGIVNPGTLSGTSKDVASAAEAIMNTDDVNALDDIRRTTKSRGIKIMANRKIARLNRIKQ